MGEDAKQVIFYVAYSTSILTIAITVMDQFLASVYVLITIARMIKTIDLIDIYFHIQLVWELDCKLHCKQNFN